MVGEKIRAIRQEKGITAKELAEKAEVTPGYISQIERNLISPSLAVLMRIAEAADIPLVSLFSEDEKEDVMVITKEKRTKIRFPDTNIEYQFLTPYSRSKEVCTQMEIIYFKIAPKSWGSPCIQTHEAAESTYVLKGKLEYHVRDEIHEINEGDCIYVPPNTPHCLYNPGEEEVEAIGVIAPAFY